MKIFRKSRLGTYCKKNLKATYLTPLLAYWDLENLSKEEYITHYVLFAEDEDWASKLFSSLGIGN